MEKPTIFTEKPSDSVLSKLEKYEGQAIIGRVVSHIAGEDRVEMLRLEDGSEVIRRADEVITEWPFIAYPTSMGSEADGE